MISFGSIKFQTSEKTFYFIFPYGPMPKQCPTMVIILIFRLTQKCTFCNGPPKAHSSQVCFEMFH